MEWGANEDFEEKACSTKSKDNSIEGILNLLEFRHIIFI